MFSKIALASGTDPDVLETDPSLRARMEVLSEQTKIRLSASDHCDCAFSLGYGQDVSFGVSRIDFEKA